MFGATTGNLKWKSDPHCHQAFTLLPLVRPPFHTEITKLAHCCLLYIVYRKSYHCHQAFTHCRLWYILSILKYTYSQAKPPNSLFSFMNFKDRKIIQIYFKSDLDTSGTSLAALKPRRAYIALAVNTLLVVEAWKNTVQPYIVLYTTF